MKLSTKLLERHVLSSYAVGDFLISQHSLKVDSACDIMRRTSVLTRTYERFRSERLRPAMGSHDYVILNRCIGRAQLECREKCHKQSDTLTAEVLKGASM